MKRGKNASDSLTYHIDFFSDKKISGWLFFSDNKTQVNSLKFYHGNYHLFSFKLNTYRQDVSEQFSCATMCGFNYDLNIPCLNLDISSKLVINDFYEIELKPNLDEAISSHFTKGSLHKVLGGYIYEPNKNSSDHFYVFSDEKEITPVKKADTGFLILEELKKTKNKQLTIVHSDKIESFDLSNIYEKSPDEFSIEIALNGHIGGYYKPFESSEDEPDELLLISKNHDSIYRVPCDLDISHLMHPKENDYYRDNGFLFSIAEKTTGRYHFFTKSGKLLSQQTIEIKA